MHAMYAHVTAAERLLWWVEDHLELPGIRICLYSYEAVRNKVNTHTHRSTGAPSVPCSGVTFKCAGLTTRQRASLHKSPAQMLHKFCLGRWVVCPCVSPNKIPPATTGNPELYIHHHSIQIMKVRQRNIDTVTGAHQSSLLWTFCLYY